jgi:hypothetical protein
MQSYSINYLPLGGVIGLKPGANVDFWGFFSAGLRIWKEHISVSSTLIIAPALSNSPQSKKTPT